jgi:hypothetical protein
MAGIAGIGGRRDRTASKHNRGLFSLGYRGCNHIYSSGNPRLMQGLPILLLEKNAIVMLSRTIAYNIEYAPLYHTYAIFHIHSGSEALSRARSPQ